MTWSPVGCETLRRIDRAAIDEVGIPGLVLMENAGRGVVDLICREPVTGPVMIACGTGNNAGDGFVVARHLDLRGCEVHVMLAYGTGRLRGDALCNFDWLSETGVQTHADDAIEQLQRTIDDVQPAIIVDAMLGTGSRGGPRPPLDHWIRHLNRCSAKRVAIDLPSGLDADTGAVSDPTFRADVTGTLVAPKPGLITESVRPFVGQLYVIDIGVPSRLLERWGVGRLRRDSGNENDRKGGIPSME